MESSLRPQFGLRKTSGHPFRRRLPARVLRALPVFEPEVLEAMRRAELRSKPVDPRHITRQDVKDFLIAYCACFVAIMAWIA